MSGTSIVGPAQLVGHAGGSGQAWSNLTVAAQLVGHAGGSGQAWGNLTVGSSKAAAIGPVTEVDQVTIDSEQTRNLNAEEEGFRAIVAAGALQIAVTDWGWTGFDATLFALTVWFAVGSLLRQR